jgi:hypothetical protein
MVATNRVVSIVIAVEHKEEAQEFGVQRPVYYVSEVLMESKQRYPHYQKMAYRVFLASRKLRHYFYDHKITVVSKTPLKDIINNSDAIGRVAKWGIELASFDIDYKPRTAIKSHALAEFMADWKEAHETTPVPEPEHWVMHFDGSNLLHGSGAGVTLKSPKGMSSATFSKSTSPPPTTSQSMKRYCTGYALQKRSAFNTSCVVGTLTLSLSRWLAHARLGTKLWRPTKTKWTRWPKVSSATT